MGNSGDTKEAQIKKIRTWVQTHSYLPSVGRIVLAAPGSGKSTWIAKHPDWIDADDIMKDLGIHEEGWHYVQHTDAEVEQHYRRCDQLLGIMREEGLKVLGSLFWEFKADAIVQINEEVHQEYVKQRKDLKWKDVQEVREVLTTLAKDRQITVHDTFDKACRPLTIKSMSLF